MKKAKFFLSLSALLSASGRMSRLQYFVYGLIYAAIFFAVFLTAALNGLFMLDDNGDLTNPTPMSIAIYGVIYALFLYGLFGLYAKRLHDLGWPAALGILVIIDIPVDLIVPVAKTYIALPPVVDLVRQGVDLVAKIATIGLGLMLTFRPGDRGTNKYGPDPLKPPAPPIDVF